MKLLRTLVPALAVALPGAAAQAADDVQQLRIAALAATCANCHGTAGAAVDKSVVPGLAGLQPAYFVTQMKEFRGSGRNATVMHQIAKGYSEAQIEQLAAYFAAQKR
ncbi:c-type cytochrome [Aquincola sp. S2]|uniref:C-type cytochrome n=1 Tax=Pseudaquabacterium terrae TaxID=2732868 RepID=A0ABX2EBQ0_9BURK|nr:c-type cytochrome [Aquabacterium terrae]NRF66202.1 c-type cytochrome [Aquabacterium terrae]